VSDQTVRASAHLTLTQVSLSLGMRGTRLAAELGHPDLFKEAADSARLARRTVLAEAVETVEMLRRTFLAPNAIHLIQDMQQAPQEFEPWFAMELSTHALWILRRLEESANDEVYASDVIPILPAAYKLYGVVDAEERIKSYRRQAIQKLIAARLFASALPLIDQDPDATPALKAECYEGMGNYAEAAEILRSMGKLKDALRNYRSIPDFEKALELMRELGGEPAAAESLEWIAELRQVLEKRPPNLLRTATAAEKKFLTALFEAQLEGPRVKKAPAKPRAPRKPGSKPAAKAAVKRK
jgi:hypothetical protein